jgi:hypothetical protein
MSSTDSGVAEKVEATRLEQMVDMARNGWTVSIGIAAAE